MLQMPGIEISPGQLKSKWKPMVRMQRYLGNKAQSGLNLESHQESECPMLLSLHLSLLPQHDLLCLTILPMTQHTSLSSTLTLKVSMASQLGSSLTSLVC